MRVSAAAVALVAILLAITSVGQSAFAEAIEGTVTLGDKPLGGSTVTLWRTNGKEAPKSLAR